MDSAGCIYIYICANITKEGGFLLKTNANCSPASKKKIKSVNILAWRGRGLWVPIPNWRALDCWWLERRNNTLSLGMWILVGWPCSCECFHTHAYMGKKKIRFVISKKDMGGDSMNEMVLGEELGSDYDQNTLEYTCMKFSKIIKLYLKI